MKHIILTLLLSSGLLAQSIYHRVGYGQFESASSAYDASIGYASIALRDSTTLLSVNPAAWNRLNRVYFRMSSSSTLYSVQNPELVGQAGTESYVLNQTGFSQMQLGLPLGKNVGFSIGLEPVTNMHAALSTETELGLLNETVRGGTWRYYAGLGYQLNQTLSLGLRMDLLNGFYERGSILKYDSLIVDGAPSDEVYSKGNVLGSSVGIGLQARITPALDVGITASLPLDEPVFDGTVQLSGSEQELDFQETLSAWPIQIGLGTSYQYRERLLVLAGLSQTIFSENAFEGASFFALPQGWTSRSIGEFQLGLIRQAADLRSRDWYERAELRAGFFTRNFYLTPVSEQLIYEYFATGGFGLPLMEGRSRIDLALEVGKRSGVSEYPDEWITRVRFGVQLYERWFTKVKRR